MPPRHAYWTIIVDDQPTSFRAHDVEELLPTFNRLREKHPNAQLKWFERGQLFDTRDAAREQGYGQGERRWEGPRPDRDADSFVRNRPTDDVRRGGPSGPPERRGKDWRPGGEHRDPRQKYKDAKKAKWDRYKQNLRSRWEEKRGAQLPPPEPDSGEHTPPHGDPIRPKLKPRRDLGAPAAMRNDRGDWRDRPRDDRRRDERPREDRREWRRDDDRRRDGWRRDDRPRDSRSGGASAPPRERDDRRGGWKPKGPPRHDRERKPWGAKPSGGPRKPWGAKPGGARKPFGSKPAGGGFRKKPFGSGPPRGPRKKRRDEE